MRVAELGLGQQHFFVKLFYCRGDPHSPLLLNRTHCTDIYKEGKKGGKQKVTIQDCQAIMTES
jgi:hypothetical protein